MKLDPVTLEILGHKVTALTEEMCLTLQRTGRTLYVKETADFCCAMAGLDGKFFAYPRNMGVSGFVGLDCLATIQAVGPLEPGDVIITNDPYLSKGLATHLTDIQTIAPYFHEGRVVAYGWAFLHASDVGGRVPSSISPTNTEIFQEGLQIPPLKLVRKGVLNEDVVAFLNANSRTPDANLGDIKAMLAALATGSKRIAQIIARHGGPVLLQAQEDLQEYSALRAEHRLAADSGRVAPLRRITWTTRGGQRPAGAHRGLSIERTRGYPAPGFHRHRTRRWRPLTYSAGLQFFAGLTHALGGELKNPQDVDKAFKKLAELKANVAALPNSPGAIQTLLERGEIWVVPFWDGRVFALQKQGLKVDFAYPTDGPVVGAANWVIAKGAPNMVNAYKLLNFLSSAKVQKAFSDRALYGMTNKDVVYSDNLKGKVQVGEEAYKKLIWVDYKTATPNLVEWSDRWSKALGAGQ
ncbi:hypothetical protein CDEF62S_06304 [Castellaniella defragrans]